MCVCMYVREAWRLLGLVRCMERVLEAGPSVKFPQTAMNRKIEQRGKKERAWDVYVWLIAFYTCLVPVSYAFLLPILP